MDIKTLDGIDIHVLPECGFCCAAYKNPMDLDECPTGNEYCLPEGCMNYEERCEVPDDSD